MADRSAIELASNESRLLPTFDRDFGELAFRARVQAPCGIVLVRLPPAAPEAIATTIASALESRDDWAGHFAVLEPGRLRMTPLPRV